MHQRRPCLLGPLLLLGGLLLAPASAEELSLRERIERARAAARERARQEMAEEATEEEVEAYDPKKDPDMWRVRNFLVPSHLSFGSIDDPRTAGRFYAPVPRKAFNEGLSIDTTVYFYFLDEAGALKIGGRGKVVKIQPGRGRRVVEARVEACRFTTKRSVKVINKRGRRDQIQQLVLLPDKHPRKFRWYMSAKLKGPEVESWDPETIRRFALGQPWMGMSRGMLEAMMGLPEEKIEAAGVVSLVYGTGQDAMRYDITDGVVTGRVPVNQF